MNIKEFFALNEIQAIIRIVLAVFFGALIGLEREHAHKSAGLRTHILVCIGSCLVMQTSEFLHAQYHSLSPNMDVARLSAQVISGIGFLGAGTILREGSSVKGLTTAASIWAVACVGLATGCGFYLGSAIATVVIFLCLTYNKNFIENKFNKKKFILKITSNSDDINLIIEKIENNFQNKLVKINGISLNNLNDNNTEASFDITMNESEKQSNLLNDFRSLPGIISLDINSEKNIKEEE